MASSYSSLLKIELPNTGEQNGAWGTTTNVNMGTAIEEAITGLANANFATDADLTLSLSNANTTQVARNLFLNATSSGSLTATRNLIVPTSYKQYIVKNATTGGQSIVVKTAAGTGVTIPNGAITSVFVDGTNVVGTTQYLSQPIFAGAQEIAVDLGAGSNIDLAQGNYFYKTITGTTTLTLSNIPPTPYVGNFILELTNAGAHTVNFFSGVLWDTGIPETFTVSGKDVLGFFSRDAGTAWNTFVIGKDMS